MDEGFGNLMMAGAVFGLAILVPLIILISIVVLVKFNQKTAANNMDRSRGIIHTITSIIYIGIALWNTQLILWDLVVNGGGLLIPLFWAMGSIIVSRILINKNKALVAYLILFSVPLVAWLSYLQLFNN